MFQIGDLEIHLLCDSLTRIDGGGMFGLVPRKLWGRHKPFDNDNLIYSNTLCLLVKAAGKRILVDTGMGENKLTEKEIKRWQVTRPHGSLHQGLARLGLRPKDIDIVINTHLHSDHCGGNTIWDEYGEAVPAFPNAVHYVQTREYKDAINPNERTEGTYFPVNFQPLMESGQFVLLDAPQTEIIEGVQTTVTRGHTPAHMSVIFESKDEYAFFPCDMASMAVHFEKLAWMTAYDVEPLITLEYKRFWQKWALEKNALIFLVHDWEMPVARLKDDGSGNLKMIPVPYEYS